MTEDLDRAARALLSHSHECYGLPPLSDEAWAAVKGPVLERWRNKVRAVLLALRAPRQVPGVEQSGPVGEGENKC
jgi:hypothetical protein